MASVLEIPYENALNESQIDVIQEIVAKDIKTAGLSLPLGFGKTRTSICLANTVSELPSLFVVSKTLIPGWINEIEKAFGKDYPYEILHRSYIGENYAMWKPKETTKIVITTSDVMSDAYKEYNVEHLVVHHIVPDAFAPAIVQYILPDSALFERTHLSGPGYIYTTKWGSVVVDEIQKYTEVTRAKCRSIAAVASHYRWGLSGTMFDEPKASRLLGFFALLHLPGPRTLPDMLEFVTNFPGLEKYVVRRERTVEFDKTMPEYNEEIVTHVLSEDETTIFGLFRDVLKAVSEKSKTAQYMGDEITRRRYAAYVLAMVTYMRQALICPLIPITSIYCDMGDFEKRSELSQIATDVFRKHNMEHYLQDERNIISSRFTKVLQKLEKHMGERCVVFSTFRTVTDLLMSLIEKSRPAFTISAASSIKQRRKLISDFEESENGVLVIPYDIGAEGLNLQCASAVFLVDLWWNTAKTNQAIGRVFRQGQKAEKIHVYFFVSNTVVENTIIRKGKMKEQILSELMTGTCNLNEVPKIPLKDIVKMISLENNVDEISSLRDKKL